MKKKNKKAGTQGKRRSHESNKAEGKNEDV